MSGYDETMQALFDLVANTTRTVGGDEDIPTFTSGSAEATVIFGEPDPLEAPGTPAFTAKSSISLQLTDARRIYEREPGYGAKLELSRDVGAGLSSTHIPHPHSMTYMVQCDCRSVGVDAQIKAWDLVARLQQRLLGEESGGGLQVDRALGITWTVGGESVTGAARLWIEEEPAPIWGESRPSLTVARIRMLLGLDSLRYAIIDAPTETGLVETIRQEISTTNAVEETDIAETHDAPE